MMEVREFPRFRLFVPGQAVGASVVFFDLFNRSDTGHRVQVWSVIPIVVSSTAVTGVVGIDLFLTRTTAVGTGGTAADRNGTSLTAATFSSMDDAGVNLPGGITARLTPTGGATAGPVISYVSVFGEETNSAAYNGHTNCFIQRLRPSFGSLTLKQGTGMRVVQSTVASAGNVAFDVMFTVVPSNN